MKEKRKKIRTQSKTHLSNTLDMGWRKTGSPTAGVPTMGSHGAVERQDPIRKRFSRLILLILLGILFLGFILRFYKIHEWLFFGTDQEYEAFLIKNILSAKHFPAIGVNAGDTGLYLGPLFIYFAAIPYWLAQGNPLGGAVTASLMGVLTTFMMYIVGKKWRGERVGLIASFLYASSFVAVLYDRQFWNPTPLPLLTLIIIYSLSKALAGNKKYIILNALALGLALQSHLQAVVLLVIDVESLLFYRRKIGRKYILIFISILFIFQVPLIFFDLRHDFTNARALKNLITAPLSDNKDIVTTSLPDRFSQFTTTLGRMIYISPGTDLYLENGQCKPLFSHRGRTHLVVILISIVSIFWFFFKSLKKRSSQNTQYFILLSLLSITLVGLMIYNRRISEYYFLYLIPVMYLIFAYLLSNIFQKKMKILIPLFLLIFFILNARTFFSSSMSYSFQEKLEAITFASMYVEYNNYELITIGGCSKYGGYRYLFEYFGKRPATSYMDPYFSWIYGEPTNKNPAKSVVLVLIDDREATKEDLVNWGKREKSYRKNMIAEKQFGKIRVMVAENE